MTPTICGPEDSSTAACNGALTSKGGWNRNRNHHFRNTLITANRNYSYRQMKLPRHRSQFKSHGLKRLKLKESLRTGKTAKEYRAFEGVGLDRADTSDESKSSQFTSSSSESSCSCPSTADAVFSSASTSPKDILTKTSSEHWKSYLPTKIQNKKTKCLMDIAIRTIQLVQRNKVLQYKLVQLQRETQDFVQSVMANPENKNLKYKAL